MRWCATDNAWVQRTISSSWSSPSVKWSQRTERRWPAWQQMLPWLSYFTGPSFPASTPAFRRILVCECLLNIYIPIPRFSPIHLKCDWLRYSCRIKWNLDHFLPPYKYGFVGWESEGACHQACGPGFEPCTPHGGKRELPPTGCPFTATHGLWHMCTHVHTHSHKTNQCEHIRAQIPDSDKL